MAQPEPWLRGPMPDIPAHVMPVFFSFAQVREDLSMHVSPLTAEQIWRVQEGASIGFHLRHMAGSVDRLTTYLMGGQLSATQLRALEEEAKGGAEASELIAGVEDALYSCERQLLTIDPKSLYDSRYVGRKRLPTTVLGLMVHLAEHTQRHLGQVITLSKAAQSGP